MSVGKTASTGPRPFGWGLVGHQAPAGGETTTMAGQTGLVFGGRPPTSVFAVRRETFAGCFTYKPEREASERHG